MQKEGLKPKTRNMKPASGLYKAQPCCNTCNIQTMVFTSAFEKSLFSYRYKPYKRYKPPGQICITLLAKSHFSLQLHQLLRNASILSYYYHFVDNCLSKDINIAICHHLNNQYLPTVDQLCIGNYAKRTLFIFSIHYLCKCIGIWS